MAKNNNIKATRRGEDEMKYKPKKPTPNYKKELDAPIKDDLFERCIKKGLIEKTEYGYYFTPEFFETLEVYED